MLGMGGGNKCWLGGDHLPPGGPFSVSGGNVNNTSGGYKYFYFTSGGLV